MSVLREIRYEFKAEAAAELRQAASLSWPGRIAALLYDLANRIDEAHAGPPSTASAAELDAAMDRFEHAMTSLLSKAYAFSCDGSDQCEGELEEACDKLRQLHKIALQGASDVLHRSNSK